MKKGYKNIFIIITPLHLWLTNILIKELKLENVLIISQNYKIYKELKNKGLETILYKTPEFQENYLYKLKELFLKIIFNYKFPKLYCEKIFIPGDTSLYTQLLLKKINYEELNIIEEGGILFNKINELNIKKYIQVIKIILKFLMGVERNIKLLESKKIKKAFVFFPSELKKFNSKIQYKDLSKIIKKNIEKIEVEEEYKNIDYLILTQPLTEDRLTTDKIEIEIIKKFIQKEKNYLIKLHPRDKKEKYKEILSLDNVKLLDNKYQNIPYQILHYSLNPKNIVSHFSSVLYTTPTIRKDFKRIALVKELKNEKIFETVNIMSKYIEIEIK